MKRASNHKLKIMKIGATVLNALRGFPFSNFYSGIGHILMFHRVVPNVGQDRIWANSFLEVSTEYFESVINYYVENQYDFVTLDELLRIMDSEVQPKRKVVHFTFDDGYKDNLYYALPLLKKYNIPATIYVTNCFPNQKATLWWYDLENYIQKHSTVEFMCQGKKHQFILKTKTQKEEAFNVLHHIIQNENYGSIETRLEDLFNQLDIDKYACGQELAMTWEELIKLSQEPLITIGGHTYTHPNLGQLNKEELLFEIKDSKLELSAKLNIQIEHFAFPFGGMEQVTEDVINILEDCGFESAVTTFSSNVFLNHKKHVMQLPRIAVGMSMHKETFDLIRHGVIPFLRNKGKQIILKL